MSKWTEFWFEGNLYFGTIRSPDAWRKVLRAYTDPRWGGIAALPDPLDAKQHMDGGNQFGFYAEYHGTTTLREWAKSQGMEMETREVLASAEGGCRTAGGAGVLREARRMRR